MAKYKKPKVLKKSKRLTKVKGTDLKKDKKLQALPPGKRRSKSGNIYYEYRENRADLKKDVSSISKLLKKAEKKLSSLSKKTKTKKTKKQKKRN